VRRRLAAILCADVVGYSRLMGVDEAGTLAGLKGLRRDLVDPKVATYGGRIFKTTGDGFLAEFPSAVNAVRFAMDMQAALGEGSAGRPEDRRIAFRIGINVGDVIVEDDDLYGDGVNVAARLESLAEPGGVCVSANVVEQVRNKIEAGFADLGEQRVKNIAEPIRIYRLAPGKGRAHEAPRTPPPSFSASADRKSIVVLAFENMSRDPEQEYFSDGIAEDIITDLSKISGLFVIARNSAFAYKGKAINLQQVSRELGVRYVLEGSVRKAGARVRVTAQLIDGTTGGHVWAERYDRDLSDIFAVQDELTKEIVSALALKLTDDERRRLSRRGTDNVEAYDLFLRGRELIWLHTQTATYEGRKLLERATALDPAFAAAYAFLGFSYMHDYINQWGDDPEGALQRGGVLARKAADLDASEAQAHFVLSAYSLWTRDHERAIAAAGRVLALDPNFVAGQVALALALTYAGRALEALPIFDEALRRDPHYPDTYLHFLSQAYFQVGRYEDAVAAALQRIERNPGTDASRALLAASYGHLGRIVEGRAAWQEVRRVNPAYSLEQRRQVLPYKNPADFDLMVEGIRKLGVLS
jgi:TolB-like protein/class 3 adenylate cyclase/cytochrome c-type biogenesis protein CcmH/NrfG